MTSEGLGKICEGAMVFTYKKNMILGKNIYKYIVQLGRFWTFILLQKHTSQVYKGVEF
jgi:hypothetical protein